jgi:GNAT superfamily N-acetyltransferase
MTMLKFEPVTKYERGLISQLLLQGFTDVMDDALKQKIEVYDEEVYDNPDTIGACVFITIEASELVGMASWDPRQWPEMGIIGWNCVLPKHSGNDIGKAQIEEILKRFRNADFEKAFVKTCEHPFFDAAQRMYRQCGFHVSKRHDTGGLAGYGTIDYEMQLK